MKTKDEIKAEVEKLERIKPALPRRSAFGDDNHDAVDATVQVLEDGMSEDDIYGAWGDEEMEEFQQNVLDAALDAHRWMHGESDEAPSIGWEPLVL